MWDRLSERNQHLVSLTVLLTLSVTFFAPIHFSGKQLVAGDTIQWRAMAQSMIEHEEESGEASYWAGRVFAGMPGYMISPELSIPQVDTLMRELRKLAWPSSHMMLLFAGMYLLAWHLTRESLASVLAAVIYGFTTYIPVILVAGHNSKFIALAWAPWMLLAFIHAMRKRSVVSGLLFAVALAANLRAGHVQITYYVTFIAGIWWLVEGVHAYRADTTRAFLKSSGMLLVGSVLGLMMVAQPYLAHAELTPFTTRGSAVGGATGGMAWEYAMAWSQGTGEMLTLLIADAYGGASPTYWGGKTFTGGPHHLGVLAIMMSFIAIWKVRDETTLALTLSAVLIMFFALGENLAMVNRGMFDYFPLFSAFRVPETWLSVLALVAALLGAHGLVSIRRKRNDESVLSSQPWLRIGGGLAVFLVILLVFGTSIMGFEQPFERGTLVSQIQAQNPGISTSNPRVVSFIDSELATRVEERVDRFQTDAGRALAVLLLGGLLLVLYYRRTIPYWLLACLVVLIVAVDLMGVGRRHVREEVLSEVIQGENRVPQYPFDDFLLGQKEILGGEGAFRVLSLENGLHPTKNARPSYFHESLGGYSGAKLRVYQDFLDNILFSSGASGLNSAAMNMTNVRYLIANRAIPGYDLVFQDDRTDMSVFENPDVLHRAFLVEKVTPVPDAQTAWARLNSPDFNPAREALVYDADSLPGGLLSSYERDSTAVLSVVTESYQAEDMTFRIRSERARLLVVSEVYYPRGWNATVNGETTGIVQVNHLLRGVPVPEGESTVRLLFRPPSQRNGVLITGLGTVLTYGLLLFFGFMFIQDKRKKYAER